jgi:hypothetical protein
MRSYRNAQESLHRYGGRESSKKRPSKCLVTVGWRNVKVVTVLGWTSHRCGKGAALVMMWLHGSALPTWEELGRLIYSEELVVGGNLCFSGRCFGLRASGGAA